MFHLSTDTIPTVTEVRNKLDELGSRPNSFVSQVKSPEIAEIVNLYGSIVDEKIDSSELDSLAGRMSFIEDTGGYTVTPRGLFAIRCHLINHDKDVTDAQIEIFRRAVKERIESSKVEKLGTGASSSSASSSAPANVIRHSISTTSSSSLGKLPSSRLLAQALRRSHSSAILSRTITVSLDPASRELLTWFETLLSNFEGNAYLGSIVQDARRDLAEFKSAGGSFSKYEKLQAIVNHYKLLLLKDFMKAIKLSS